MTTGHKSVRLFIWALCLMAGSAFAQSSLPACQGSDDSRWTNCFGTLTPPNGYKYVVDFKDGKPNGQGTVTLANGNKYVGDFKDGKPSGQGMYTFANGDKYVGDFKDGKPNGQGTNTFANGNKYVGDFKDGKPNGQVTATFVSGNKYVGDFKDGKRNGQGTLTSANGNKYVGDFKDDKPNGQGIEYRADGTIIRSGQYVDGKLAQSFWIDTNRFPFNAPTQTAQSSRAETDRVAAEAQAARLQELEQRLATKATEGEAAKHRQQELQAQLASSKEREGIESSLPACQGSDVSRWTNCFGRYTCIGGKCNSPTTDIWARGTASKYVGEFKDGDFNGQGIQYSANGTIVRSGRWAYDKLVQSFAIDTNRFPFNATTQTAQSSRAEADRVAAEAQAARQQELEQRLAVQALEAEAAKRRQQELEAQLAAAQSTALPTAVRIRNAHALVIGNAAYPGSNRLDNTINDANAISQKLRSMGFTVTTVKDTNRQQLVQAMSQFKRTAANAELSLFFYAGHGVQIFGTNYILPTDVDQNDVAQATIQGVSLNSVVENFLPGKTKLVFLDACRDNPLQRSGDRSVSKGLAPISVAQGTLISYATKDGQTASDGAGAKNSPFTQALLQHLDDPADIAVVLRKVREKVMQATGGKQQPWEYGSLIGGELVLSAIKPK